jgi:hypothetical protein
MAAITIFKRGLDGVRHPMRVRFELSEAPNVIARRVCDANALGERDYESIARYLERLHVCVLSGERSGASAAAGLARAPRSRATSAQAPPLLPPPSALGHHVPAAESSESESEEEQRDEESLSDSAFDEVHYIEQQRGLLAFWQTPQKIRLRFHHTDDPAWRAAQFCRKHQLAAEQTSSIREFIIACQEQQEQQQPQPQQQRRPCGGAVAIAALQAPSTPQAVRSAGGGGGGSGPSARREGLCVRSADGAAAAKAEEREADDEERSFALTYGAHTLHYTLSEGPFSVARRFVAAHGIPDEFEGVAERVLEGQLYNGSARIRR